MLQFEKETGIKYINTYVAILGTEERDSWEDWFEIENWAALDKMRGSPAGDEWTKKTWNFLDQHTGKTRVVRTINDVMTYSPP